MKYYKPLYIIEAISMCEKIIITKRREMGDESAGILNEKLEIFETMWDGKELAESRVPKFMKPLIVKVEWGYDPEYQTYLELKKKYESN